MSLKTGHPLKDSMQDETFAVSGRMINFIKKSLDLNKSKSYPDGKYSMSFKKRDRIIALVKKSLG